MLIDKHADEDKVLQLGEVVLASFSPLGQVIRVVFDGLSPHVVAINVQPLCLQAKLAEFIRRHQLLCELCVLLVNVRSQ